MEMNLLNIGVALLGGAIAKKVGKSKLIGGNRPLQKILAPIAAVGVGMAASAVTGGDVPLDVVLQNGGEAGALAIAAHSSVKNLIELIRGNR